MPICWTRTIVHGSIARAQSADRGTDTHHFRIRFGETFERVELSYEMNAADWQGNPHRVSGGGSARILNQPQPGTTGWLTLEVAWAHKRRTELILKIEGYSQPVSRTHCQLYGELRKLLLSRHFALGRFWRTNHFDVATNLGSWYRTAWQQFRSESPNTAIPPQYDARYVLREPAACRRWGHPNTYGNTPGFPTDAAADETERWRIMSHDRSNPLLWMGIRLMGLCAEHRLGHPDAVRVIKVCLKTLDSLFKYASNEDDPFAGYLLRWDPATCDNWDRHVDQSGQERPGACCEFLLRAGKADYDAPGRRYHYTTPLWDSRYVDAVNATDRRGRYRRWEPSMEEYLGIVVGYWFVFRTYEQDPSPEARWIIDQVKRQVRRIARYLHHVGYILVRPEGGFPINGAAETNSAVEYPLSQTFERILGSEAPSGPSGKWRWALHLAGVRQGAPDPGPAAPEARPSVLVQALFGVPRLGPLLGTAKVMEIIARPEVWKDLVYLRFATGLAVEDGEIRGELALARIAKALEPKDRWVMGMTRLPGGGYALNDTFKVLAGLLAEAEAPPSPSPGPPPKASVRKMYLQWYEQSQLPIPESYGEVQDHNSSGTSGLRTAVACRLMPSGPKRDAELGRLAMQLFDMRREYTEQLGYAFWRRDIDEAEDEWSRFFVADVVDLPQLAQKLRAPSRPVEVWLVAQLSAGTRVALTNFQPPASASDPLLQELLQDLNRLVLGASIYDAQRFAGVALRPDAEALRETLRRNGLDGKELARFNRLLIKDAFPLEFDGYVEETSDCRGKGWGYLAALTSAWLLQIEDPNLGIRATGEPLPNQNDVAKWPAVVLPGPLFEAVRRQELHLPLGALRTGFAPPPNWNQDVNLLDEPIPDKPADHECGSPPPPRDEPPVEFRMWVAWDPTGRLPQPSQALPARRASDGWRLIINRVEVLPDSFGLEGEPIIEPDNGGYKIKARAVRPGLANPSPVGFLHARVHWAYVFS